MKVALVVIAIALAGVVGLGVALLSDDEDLGPQADVRADRTTVLEGQEGRS